MTQAWAAPDRARVGPVSERDGPREEEAPSRGPVGLSTHASLSGIGTRAEAVRRRSRSLLKGDGRGLPSHGTRFRCSGRLESVTPTASWQQAPDLVSAGPWATGPETAQRIGNADDGNHRER